MFIGGVFGGYVIPQNRKKISLLPQYRTLKMTITEDEQKFVTTVFGYQKPMNNSFSYLLFYKFLVP